MLEKLQKLWSSCGAWLRSLRTRTSVTRNSGLSSYAHRRAKRIGFFVQSQTRKEKQQSSWSAWVGSPVAWLALLVSGLTAYVNLFRQSDDVRIVIYASPSVAINVERKRLEIDGVQKIAVMNNGTRTAFIQRAGLTFSKVTPGLGEISTSLACRGQRVELFYDLAEFTVKPGEILTKTMTIDKRQGSAIEDRADARGLPFQFIEPKRGDLFFVCLTLNLATPDEFIYQKDIGLFQSTLQLAVDTVLLDMPGDAALTSPTRPLGLYRKISTVWPF